MGKILFNVSGMKCGGCVSKIETELNTISSIENFDISLENQQVRIHFDNTLIKSLALKVKIEELGFKVIKMQKE